MAHKTLAAAATLAAVLIAPWASAQATSTPQSNDAGGAKTGRAALSRDLLERNENESSAAVQRDFQLSAADTAARMTVQEQLHAVPITADPGYVDLRQDLASGTVTYLSQSESIPAAVTKALEALPAPEVVVREAPFAEKELHAAAARIRERVPSLVADSDLDLAAGAVKFFVTQMPDEGTRSAIEASAAPVKVLWQVTPTLGKPLTGGGGAMTSCTGGSSSL